MTGAVCGAGYAYAFGAPLVFRGLCCPVTCVSLFHVIVLSFDCMVSLYFLVTNVYETWVWEKKGRM